MIKDRVRASIFTLKDPSTLIDFKSLPFPFFTKHFSQVFKQEPKTVDDIGTFGICVECLNGKFRIDVIVQTKKEKTVTEYISSAYYCEKYENVGIMTVTVEDIKKHIRNYGIQLDRFNCSIEKHTVIGKVL